MPIVVVITGCPGSGKSTLAAHLAEHLGFKMISRDLVKKELLIGQGQTHIEAGKDMNEKASGAFFDSVNRCLKSGQNLIIEAAFQHKIWAPWLEQAIRVASVRLLVCEVTEQMAVRRFDQRRITDSDRIQFHGDDLLIGHQLIRDYQAPDSNPEVACLTVNCTDGYQPSFDQIAVFCGPQ